MVTNLFFVIILPLDKFGHCEKMYFQDFLSFIYTEKEREAHTREFTTAVRLVSAKIMSRSENRETFPCAMRANDGAVLIYL